jgi:hypothetical protein
MKDLDHPLYAEVGAEVPALIARLDRRLTGR